MIDVYPIGALKDLIHIRGAWRTGHLSVAYAITRARIKYTALKVWHRKWHSLKCDFNGYLAEPRDWPPGLTRCGTGWTRRRALMSLRYRAAREIRPAGTSRSGLIVEINTMLEGGV